VVNVVNLLRLKAASLSSRNRCCVLMMDEMSLKRGLRYCKLRDAVIGFDDDGEVRLPQLSSSVLVFMVRGLFGNWKQCVSFVLTSHVLQADNVKSYQLDTLLTLERVGLSVKAVVSDQGPIFCKMFGGFGVSPAKPWSKLNGDTICVFPDPPHLLKNVRNALYRYNISHADGVAKWGDISDLFKGNLPREYRLAPKLTRKHIELPLFTQMTVKLAAQVLSHSTAAATRTHMEVGSMPAEAAATAVLCQNFNDLFDCFNSMSKSGNVQLRTAISRLPSREIGYIGKLAKNNTGHRSKNGKERFKQVSLFQWLVSGHSSFTQIVGGCHHSGEG